MNVDKNPYEPPSPKAEESSGDKPADDGDDNRDIFPFFLVGPILGTCVGLTKVSATVTIWGIHKCPEDFIFRSIDGVFLYGLMLGIAGTIVGFVFSTMLLFVSNSLGLAIRLRFLFYFTIGITFVTGLITTEISFQRALIVDPFLTLAGIVVVSLLAALISSKKKGKRRDLKTARFSP
ncbi:MAG: hypothetical protein AAF483_07325 [Planctomycetota bacterium]